MTSKVWTFATAAAIAMLALGAGCRSRDVKPSAPASAGAVNVPAAVVNAVAAPPPRSGAVDPLGDDLDHAVEDLQAIE